MPQNFTTKKQNAVSKLQANCTQILDILNTLQALKSEMVDDGFGVGGAQPLTDADLQANGFAWLQASDVVAAFAAIAAIDGLLAANTRTHYKSLTQMRS